MKQPFTFSVLRYVHDVVTGEFVNVGVIMSCPAYGFLDGRFETRYRRISDLFGKRIDGNHFRHMLRSIEERLRALAEEPERTPLLAGGVPDAVDVARSILPLDDSALQFHRGGAGVTDDPAVTQAYLFARYVTRYVLGKERPSRSDQEVLSVLRGSLAEADLETKVRSYRFKSRAFEHEFPISWRNGRMNVCEPLSFDLIHAEDIRNKAFRWVGHSKSIREKDPILRLIFFLGRPIHTGQLKGFEEGCEILNRYVEGERLVIDEERSDELIRRVQAEVH